MNFLDELKRRNVIRVGIAYVVVAWLLAQVADLALENFEAPGWVIKTILLMLALGLPLALFFAWAFELTPEGIKKEKDVDRSASITHKTGRKLDFVIIGVLVVALGYFIWESRIADNQPEPATIAKQADIANTTSQTPAISEQSVAVLPFANRSRLDDDLFFTDGIHDDLLTQLAKIKDLKVISRTSVMQYRDTNKPIPQIAQELGVAAILEGGVQRAGHRIRINAQLIDVATDEHLWAETFNREMTIDNLFEIQSEITKQIVTAVRGQLTPEEQQSLAIAPTQNFAAYEAYQHARNLLRSSGYNIEKFKAAQPILEQAVALDPNFGLAYVQLADVHGMAYWMGYDTTSASQLAARDALDQAKTQLGPDSPELQLAQGRYSYRFEQNYASALNALLKAHAAMPGDADVLTDLGLTQRRLGLWEEAVASLLQAAELDPADVSARSLAVETLLNMRHWSHAEEVLQSARARFPDDTDLAALAVLLPLWADGDVKTARARYQQVRSDSGESFAITTTELPWFDRDFAGVVKAWTVTDVMEFASGEGNTGDRELNLAMAYQKLGEADRANQLLDEAVQSLGNLDRNRRDLVVANELSTLAIALALQGEKARAVELAEEATRVHTLASDKVEGTWPLKWLCYVLALTGERDRALELIGQLIDQPGGFVRWELYLDPRWDFFRDDERFNKLIKPLNFDESMHANKETKD